MTAATTATAISASTGPTPTLEELVDRLIDAVFAELDLADATDGEVRWATAEFLDLARRCLGGEDAWLYRAGSGRAGVLILRDDETLEVRAVLGMRWRPGKLVSRRSLRGLRALRKGGPA